MLEQLTSAAAENYLQIFSSEEHANQMKFKGILVNLDVPSTKPPNGSQGKRILIPTSTAKAALHTLKNMGLNYTDNLDGHNPRKKVGVIKKAWIEGSAIHVEGIIWKRDFPEAEKDLKQKNLGMSFEATNIQLENPDANVWKITGMCFTGASILFKKDAAYFATEALAAAAEKLKHAASQTITKIHGGKISMAHKQSKKEAPAKKPSKKVSASADNGEQLGEVLSGLTASFKDMSKAFTTMAASNHALRSELHLVAAGIKPEVEDESESLEAAGDSESASESQEDVNAGGWPPPDKKKKKHMPQESDSSESFSDSESMSAEAESGAGDLENMESESAEEDDKPGSLNKNAKQKGSQTKVEDKVGKEVNDPILGSSAQKKLLKAFKQLQASQLEDRKTIKKLQRKVTEQQSAIQAAGQRGERRSMTPLAINLLSKGGVDADAIQASGRKLTVEEVDSMFASSGANLDIQSRMALKTEYARHGVMEEGIVQSIKVN